MRVCIVIMFGVPVDGRVGMWGRTPPASFAGLERQPLATISRERKPQRLDSRRWRPTVARRIIVRMRTRPLRCAPALGSALRSIHECLREGGAKIFCLPAALEHSSLLDLCRWTLPLSGPARSVVRASMLAEHKSSDRRPPRRESTWVEVLPSHVNRLGRWTLRS